MIEPILVVGIAIACTAWYMQHRWRRWRESQRVRDFALQHQTVLEVLATRYARGEIDREEYLQKKGDIVGAHLTP